MTNSNIKFPIHHFLLSISWVSLCANVLVFILMCVCIKALSIRKTLSIVSTPKLLLQGVLDTPTLRTAAECTPYTLPLHHLKSWKQSKVEHSRHEKEQNHKSGTWLASSPEPAEHLLPGPLWWLAISQRSLFFYTSTWSWFPGQKSVNISLLKSKNTLFWKESCVARVSWKYLLQQFKQRQGARINTIHGIQVSSVLTITIKKPNELGCGWVMGCLPRVHEAIGLIPRTSKQQ